MTFLSATNRKKWILLAVMLYAAAVVCIMMHFNIDKSNNALAEQLMSWNMNCLHCLHTIQYQKVVMLNKGTAFFKHFSKIYPNLDWNLYDYHWLPQHNELLMISIPPQNKKVIFQQLQTNSINITQLISNRHNQLLKFGPLIDNHHNILYCNIPKIATTKYQSLLYGMHENISSNLNYFAKDIWLKRRGKWIKGNEESVKHKIFKKEFIIQNLSDYISVLHDVRWTKFVIVRDPLSRSISAYDEKCKKRNAMCMNGNNRKKKKKTISYDVWLNNLQRLMLQNEDKLLWNNSENELQEQRHCSLTKYFCELPIFLPFYDYIIMYNKDYISLPTKYMVENINNHSLERFYYNWNLYGNETMFSSYSKHSISTSKEEQKHLLRRYFPNDEILQKALQIYANDYIYLPLDIPTLQ